MVKHWVLFGYKQIVISGEGQPIRHMPTVVTVRHHLKDYYMRDDVYTPSIANMSSCKCMHHIGSRQSMYIYCTFKLTNIQ